jgi:hypothetical protein
MPIKKLKELNEPVSEMFWGGTSSVEELNRLLVRPLKIHIN